MKKTLCLLALLTASSYCPGQDTPKPAPKPRAIQWRESYPKALEEASRSTRPILADFEADWCGWCKKLDRETFGNAEVIKLVETFFIPVRIDTDHQPEISAKFEVKGLPTILLLSAEGKELKRLSGFRPAEKFLTELRQAIKSAATLDELRKAAEKNPGDLDSVRAWARATFASGNPGAAEKILSGALKGKPMEPGLLLELADIKRSAGKTAEARELYKQILALGDTRGGSSFQQAHLPLARLQLGGKQYKAALETLSAYISRVKSGKGLPEAYFLRSYVHSVEDRDTEALKDLRKVLELDPDGEYGTRAGYIIDLVKQE